MVEVVWVDACRLTLRNSLESRLDVCVAAAAAAVIKRSLLFQ